MPGATGSEILALHRKAFLIVIPVHTWIQLPWEWVSSPLPGTFKERVDGHLTMILEMRIRKHDLNICSLSR